MGQRRAGRPAVPGTRAAATCPATSASTTSGSPRPAQAQAALAAHHGIDAFCYFHYWFDGRRLLERPFDEVLRSGEPDFPFCLCWANENWTRAWDGKSDEILIEQTYSREDDLAHIRALAEAFADPRYLRIDGRRSSSCTARSATRDRANSPTCGAPKRNGSGIGELYLCAVNGGRDQLLGPDDVRHGRRGCVRAVLRVVARQA